MVGLVAVDREPTPHARTIRAGAVYLGSWSLLLVVAELSEKW
jgi:hypothetical protein